MEKELSDKPIKIKKIVVFLLYSCMAISLYCAISIVTLSLNVDSVSDFFHPDKANRFLITFFLTNGFALFVGWGSGIVVHKNDKGKKVNLTKKRSRYFARYIYYSSVILLLTVVVSILKAIFS